MADFPLQIDYCGVCSCPYPYYYDYTGYCRRPLCDTYNQRCYPDAEVWTLTNNRTYVSHSRGVENAGLNTLLDRFLFGANAANGNVDLQYVPSYHHCNDNPGHYYSCQCHNHARQRWQHSYSDRRADFDLELQQRQFLVHKYSHERQCLDEHKHQYDHAAVNQHFHNYDLPGQLVD